MAPPPPDAAVDPAADPPMSPDPIVAELTRVRNEISKLRRRLWRSRLAAAFNAVLTVAVATIALVFYTDSQHDADRDAAATEERLLSGCLNAVQADERARIRSEQFAIGLGQAFDEDPATVAQFIADVEARVNAESPPRDCEAEAAARADR